MFIGLLSVCAIGHFGWVIRLYFWRYKMCISKQSTMSYWTNICRDELQWNFFYPYTVNFNKCGGSCNTIDYPYVYVCVLNKAKCKNIWFNIRINETRLLVPYEMYECKCRFNESVYNSKQKLDHDECWCECNN